MNKPQLTGQEAALLRHFRGMCEKQKWMLVDLAHRCAEGEAEKRGKQPGSHLRLVNGGKAVA